jgi:Flp pilus assembly protein TadB
MLGELPGGATDQSRAALRDAVTAFISGDQSARQSAIDALTATGMTPQQAEAQIAEWKRSYEETLRSAERTADVAADMASTLAFYGFVSLLVGAIAGAVGGWLGRPHDLALQAAR